MGFLGTRRGLHWAMAAWMLMLALPARAHDTWILPTRFQLQTGQPFSTLLSAGHGLTPLVAPRRRRMRSLLLVDSRGQSQPLHWQRGKGTARAQFAAPAPGVACLALGTAKTVIQIEPEGVDGYLREVQAPEFILQAWQRQRSMDQPWVERYTKDAKTYLRRGRTSAGWPALARLGQGLELVPLQDPTRLTPGCRFGLLLLMHGKAVPDVALRLHAGSGTEAVVRTDGAGCASFDLLATGTHLVATTVLQPPLAEHAPWTSRFATLGFAVSRR
jgi:hypothetical protein